MGRRYDHSRPEIKDMAFVAARRIAELEGYRGMTARAIAERIGYTAGTLYLAYDNLDELIDQVSIDVLTRLHNVVSAEVNKAGSDQGKLRALIRAHCDFSENRPNQWLLPWLHNRKRTTPIPREIEDLNDRIYRLFQKTLRPLLKKHRRGQIEMLSATLWGAICGTTILTLEQGLEPLQPHKPHELAEMLVTQSLDIVFDQDVAT